MSRILLCLLLTGCTTYDSSIHMKDVTITNTTVKEQKCGIRCTPIRNKENPYNK